ncbi:cell division protein FtsA [Candidatus Woesebacteria bacterium]|nr:cell division protein FtsA [Candidatus Woesebacteria bacterium]
MSKGRIIASLELGSSKIVTLIAKAETDEITGDTAISVAGVSSVASRGIRKGQIVDIEETVEAVVASVEAAERMAGYNLQSAFVALGGAHFDSQNSHGVVAVSDPSGEISPDDVARVIEAASAISLPQSREVIHVIPREFIVDGEAGVKDPVGMSGVRLEVETHIVTAASPAVKNITKAVGEVGIETEDLVFSGFAAAEATLSSTEKELGCVLIDIGGGTTSVAVFLEGALAYSGVIPVGAKNVTNDLAIGLRVSLEAAEKIKIALSEDKKKLKLKPEEESDSLELKEIGITEVKKVSKKTLIEGIIRPRLNEIFTMVKIELEKNNLGSRVPSGVILTGGGAETVGAHDAARRILALPVRIGKPEGVGGLIDEILTPAFATPIGLLIYGSKVASKEKGMSFFPKKLKLPIGGFAGKLVDAIKNLLP